MFKLVTNGLRKAFKIYETSRLWAGWQMTLWSGSLLDCLQNQNKSDFFGGPTFFQPIGAFWILFKLLCCGVARIPYARGQNIFLRPHQQKLQSFKWKICAKARSKQQRNICCVVYAVNLRSKKIRL